MMREQEKKSEYPRRKQGNKTRGKSRKSDGSERRESRPFTQHFGAGMMVNHEEYGLGHVTSAYRRYVNVHFHCDGQHRNLNHRSLKFTREEQIRRGKIRKAMERGSCVTPTCAPGTQVVHRLLGFGMVVGSKDGKLLVGFNNEYAPEEVIEANELRERLAPPPKNDDKKKRGRR